MPIVNIYKGGRTHLPVIPRELVGVSGYTEYQAAEGYAKAVVFFTDTMSVVNGITNNRTNLPALTFHNWSAGMQAKGYPSEEIRSGYDLAVSFGIIPKAIRDQLAAKPKAPAPAPAPAPPATTPGKPGKPAEKAERAPAEKKEGFFSSLPWYAWAGAAAVAVGGGMFILKRKRGSRTS